MNDTDDKPPRFAVSVSESIIVVGILTGLWAFMLPAVNAARETHGKPVVLPALHALYGRNPWPFILVAPLLTATFTAVFLFALQRLLPPKSRRLIVWKSPPKPSQLPQEPIHDWRPAAISAFLSIAAFGLTVFAGSHLRADRRSRRPVITWEGPIGANAQYLAVAAWLFSAFLFVLGNYVIYRYRSRLNPLAVAGIVLSGVTCFGSCIFYGAAFED